MPSQRLVDRIGIAIIAVASISIGAWAGWIARGTGSGTMGALAFGVFFAALVAIPTAGVWGTGLRLREKARRWYSARACPSCGASLLGLACRWGFVVCKSCGERIVLAYRGIQPAQLRARETAFDGLTIVKGARCPTCRGELGGTRCEAGHFSCPECRVKHSSTALAAIDFAEVHASWTEFSDRKPADDDAACERCGYSLARLPVEHGQVCCPECAHVNDLPRVRKLTPESRDFDEFETFWERRNSRTAGEILSDIDRNSQGR